MTFSIYAGARSKFSANNSGGLNKAVKDLPPNFCRLPWLNVDIDPTGLIRPCCKFMQRNYTTRFTVATHSLDEYKNSEFIRTLKQEMLDGKKPVGCDRCWLDEKNGIKSKRILDWERHTQEFENYDLESDEILVLGLSLGSYCNLKCWVCGPFSSSKWIKEWESHTGQRIEIQEFYKDDQFIRDIMDHIGSVIHIDFPGGEPLLTGVTEQHKILNHLIEIGAAPRISLHYTTNATAFPGPEYWGEWKEFKNVDIQMSIDDIGDRFEFNRYPAKWSTVYPIIKQYQEKEQELPNIQLSISHNLSVFTIFYLPEFYQWCLDEGLPNPWLGRLHRPEYYRFSVFPQEGKQAVIDKLNSSPHSEVRYWTCWLEEEDDSDRMGKFWEMTQKKDAYRGQSFRDTFPEIYSLLCSKR